MNTTDIRLGLVALGAVAVISQALLIREAMTTLGGSEIAWGCLLFLWLIGAALGARIGSRLQQSNALIARLSTPAIAISAIFGVVMLRAAPAISGAHPGELAPAGPTLLVWLIALLPPSMSVGLGFSALGTLSGKAAAAYGLECLGATLGGLLFTFFLAPWGTPVIAGALLGIAVAFGLGRRHPWIRTLVGLLCLALGFLSVDWVSATTWRYGGHPGTLERMIETRYQRLEISTGTSRSLYVDGRLAGTLPPDPYLILPLAELLPLMHADPKRIAVVGGLTDGMAAGLLLEPVEHLKVIEQDPGLVRLLTSGLSPEIEEVLNDPRVTVVLNDPTRGMSSLAPVDLILLLDGPPATLRSNRSRTLEFFRLCRSRLAPGGLIIVNSGVNSTYTGGHSGRLFAVQAATLTQVFPQSMAIAGDRVFFVAGLDDSDLINDPDVLIQRWRRRGSQGTPYLDQLIPTLMDRARSAELTLLMRTADSPLNTVALPSAVLAAAALTEGRGLHILMPFLEGLQSTPRWAAPSIIIIAALLVIAWGLPRERSRSEPALAIGFASMTWYLLLLGAWQGTRGAVYSEIGALTAVFMAGMVGGSMWSRRWPDPGRSLLFLLPVAAGLSWAIGSGLPASKSAVVIPLLLATGGLVTGAAFAGTAVLASRPTDQLGIGRAFSADEAGAAIAALIVGVIGLPLLGTSIVATASAVICLAAVVGVWRHETAAP
ncbi:MAG: hypothetical protein KAJ78_06430 [Acidobacteria bacterium]|nr:hypothetical protein [Acidobacteriota bacterium]